MYDGAKVVRHWFGNAELAVILLLLSVSAVGLVTPAMALANISDNGADALSEPGPQSYLPLAERMFEEGHMELAIELFSADLKRHPDSIATLFQRGLAHMLSGDQPGALSDFTLVIELDPRHGDALFNRALVYRKAGETSAALADFDTLLMIDPDRGHAYLERGLTHFSKGAHDAAFGDFTMASQLMPQATRTNILEVCGELAPLEAQPDWSQFCLALDRFDRPQQ